MRRQIIVVFFSLLTALGLLPGTAWGADRGALFKVSGHGHTMYLFGTMHVGQPGFYPLEPRITQAVSSASTLALEIDPDEDAAAMAQALSAYGMKDPAGEAEELSAPLKARVNKALAKAGLDQQMVSKFKPWLVATVLAVAEYTSQGYRADLSVDSHLAKLARSSHVRIIGLETPKSQMSLFNRLSGPQQIKFLEESLDLADSGKMGDEVKQIVETWRTADKAGFNAVAARVENDRTVSGRFLKNVLIDERNVTLADKLVDLLKRQNHSVGAIGVLHLIGSNSVPELMQARGLSVERVY